MRLVVSVVLAATVLLGSGPIAGAQEPSTSTSGVPAPDIVPEPNSGAEPTEAGDRGGVLQLLVLGLVVAAVAGAVTHLVRQSRASRTSRTTRASRASRASRPPTPRS